MGKYDSSRRKFIKTTSTIVPSIGGAILGASLMPSKKEYKDEDATGKYSDQFLNNKPNLDYDVLVYGGTSSGIIAAYTARMYGLNVLLVEPGRHLGGLSSGGLGSTDTGGKDHAITGLSKEFYTRLGEYYGKGKPMYRFEPHVAEIIFNQYVNEAQIEVFYSRRVKTVRAKNNKITNVELEDLECKNVISITAKNFIDASYEGDLMAKAGVTYTIGRESNSVYNEKYNGVLLSRVAGPYKGPVKRTSEWPVDVDPYVIPGKPSSGLLPEINSIGHRPNGEGDKSVQSYCFRMCLTQNKENQLPLTEPDKYDPERYELLARLLKKKSWEQLGNGNGFIISPMPNNKTDWNNYGLAGISSNYTGKSHEYPDANYDKRKEIWNDHINYQQGLLWYIATDKRVPSHLRDEMNSWGYCRDEFLDTNGWPHQLYIREARRMVGDFVMTEHECVGNNPVKDGIAYGAYALDSHTCNRVVVDGRVENEGNYFIGGFDPYAISYQSLVPKRKEIGNLLVSVCISSSHAAFGSVRMEPVFMALGQAAGIAAYIASEKDQAVQDVNHHEIRKELTENPLVDRKVPRQYSKLFSFKEL